MKINIFTFFSNNVVYDLVNEIVLKKNNDKNASDTKIAKLYEKIIKNGESSSLLQLIAHCLAHAVKYIFVASYRANFKPAMQEIQDKIDSLAKKRLLKNPGQVADRIRQFSQVDTPTLERLRPTRESFIDCTQPIQIEEFQEKLSGIVRRIESKATPPSFKAPMGIIGDINSAMDALKGSGENASACFFEIVLKMNTTTIRKMVEGLKTKGEGRNGLSDVDRLWKMIADFKLNHSVLAQFATKLQHIFMALSEEQLRASTACCNAITQPFKAKTIAQVINKTQLEILASNTQVIDFLYDIVKNIPRNDPFFLGKIVVLLPYATQPLDGPLKIIFRSFPVPDESERKLFINLAPNLERLLDYFVAKNEKAKAEIKEKAVLSRNSSKKWDSPDTQYKKYRSNSVATPKPVWTQAMYSDFCCEIHVVQVSDNIDYFRNKFDSMDEATLLKYVVNASTKCLDKLWEVDKTFTAQGDQIAARNERLRVVFSKLSKDQLYIASSNVNFLKLLSYNDDGISGIAAEIFTADQIGLIAYPDEDANITAQKHAALVYLINKFPKENLEQKIRAIIQYATPELAKELKAVVERRAIDFSRDALVELKKKIEKRLSV